jgi:hypothetical protein
MVRETAYDYDQSVYYVERDEDSEIVKFSFSCNGSKEILANGGEQMLGELYRGKNAAQQKESSQLLILSSIKRYINPLQRKSSGS